MNLVQTQLLAKSVLKKLAYSENLNVVARRGLKPLTALLPVKFKKRFPLVGTMAIPFKHAQIMLYGHGLDEITSKIYWDGIESYESATYAIFMELLVCANTVFDIGANIGIYGLLAALNNPTCNVYAFEPAPFIFAHLQRNVSLNKLSNIQIEGAALTDFEGKIKLYIPHAGIPTGASTSPSFRKAAEIIEVPAVTIDSYVEKQGLTTIDLMKIDTESTEHLVLAGAHNTLTRDEPMIICEVLHGLTETKLEIILRDKGYQYYQITAEGLIPKAQIIGDPTYQNSNYLFITPKRLAALKKQSNVRISSQ